jgi:hypothetical protein
MPGGRATIGKGPIFTAIDQASKARAGLDLDQILGELRSRKSLVDIGKTLGIVRDAQQEAHLRQDWFNETGRGWWRKHPVERIFRDGLIKAVELVKALDLPIDSYWLRTDSPNEPVRALVTVSDRQITVLFVSPQPKGARAARLAVDTSIWVVERATAKGRVRTANVKWTPVR